MTTALPVHPFPARMAPELALERLPMRLDRRLTVLDPMMGSGTIPMMAALRGYRAIGFDIDPLAVIIARTNGRPLDSVQMAQAADRIVEVAREHRDDEFTHPDLESQQFIDKWFDSEAQRRLGALAAAIGDAPPELLEALWCTFSRLIITKEAGASRARDVSHSRPHVVRSHASFDPIEQFAGAARAVIRRHSQAAGRRPADGRLRLNRADARQLPLADDSVDVVMTSPPYLQAIDYLRGHRMSLVWMGHTIGDLRRLRGESIGSERGRDLDSRYAAVLGTAVEGELTHRAARIAARYLSDMGAVLAEVKRVLTPSGRATFVVADATLAGMPVSLCAITKGVAELVGLHCFEHTERSIMMRNRYLPPPMEGGLNSLDKRMRVEHCLTFAAA